MTKDELFSLVSAVETTRDAILDWSYSDANNGPFSEEIYRTNVQIGSALNVLSEAIRALVKGQAA